jgi:hypothetical protein
MHQRAMPQGVAPALLDRVPRGWIVLSLASGSWALLAVGLFGLAALQQEHSHQLSRYLIRQLRRITGGYKPVGGGRFWNKKIHALGAFRFDHRKSPSGSTARYLHGRTHG